MPTPLRPLLALLLLLAAPPATAQVATVRGFVADATDRQPLQGASVALRAAEAEAPLRGTATDADGYFVLPRVPPGRYTLTVTFIGYAPHEEALTLAPGALRTLTIALAPAPEALDEVLVEAERASGVTALVAGRETVRPADIERVPTPGVSGDLVGYLQVTPGLVAPGDRGGQLYLRGGEPTQNLVLLDGLPVFQPFHLLSFYSAVPSEIVDVADVYAGGYGARYGGRLSSVIDVQTRNGNKQRFAGSAALANILSAAHVEGPLVRDRVSFVASVRESLVERLTPDLLGQRSTYRFGDRFVKLHALPSAGLSVSLTALHTADDGNVTGTFQDTRGNDAPLDLAELDSTALTWTNLGVGGTVRYLPAALPLRSDLTAWLSRTEATFGPEDAPEREASVEAVGATWAVQLTAGPGTLHLGAFAQALDLRYRLADFLGDPAATADVTQTEAGGYAELDWAPAPGLRLTPGVRLTRFGEQGVTVAAPRVRLTWSPGGLLTGHQFSAAVGRYHQGLVGLTDERDVGNVFTAYTTAPAARVPEALHALLGWRASGLLPGLDVAVEGYHKRLRHLSVPAWSVLPRFTTTLQPGRGTVWGVDVRLEARRGPFYGYAGYGYAWVRYEAEQDAFSVWFGEPQQRYHPPHDLRHQLHFLGRYAVGPVTAIARWQLSSGRPYTQSIGFDDWVLLSGSDVDVRTEPGLTRVLYDRPYTARLPAYHRLDLWLERAFEQERVRLLLRAGAVNVYNRANLFYFDLFTLRRVDQLPFTPSVGLKLEML